jgi:hypothetical protein
MVETPTEAVERKRLADARRYMVELLPLLDNRLAWRTAINRPGFLDGPEVAEANEQRVETLKASIGELLDDLDATLKNLPPVARGASVQLTPLLLSTLSLTNDLEEAGVKRSSAESSKMIRALRICWEAAGLTGDPRDSLRMLERRSKAMKTAND